MRRPGNCFGSSIPGLACADRTAASRIGRRATTGGSSRRRGSFVYALDARTGKAIAGLRREGRIDLREDLGRDPAKQSVTLTTPGVIYKDLLIVGGRTAETSAGVAGRYPGVRCAHGEAALDLSHHSASGRIWLRHVAEGCVDVYRRRRTTGRAWRWTRSAASCMRRRGRAAADFYGANRLGDDLFANTLLALDADTGERIWHFQAVKHDLWDRDFPSPPSLVTVRQNGRMVDAVAQTTKQG